MIIQILSPNKKLLVKDISMIFQVELRFYYFFDNIILEQNNFLMVTILHNLTYYHYLHISLLFQYKSSLYYLKEYDFIIIYIRN